MGKWLWLVLVCGIAASEGFQRMEPTTKHPLAGAMEISPVETLPEYVIGFPVYVAITVRARPGATFNRLRFADFTSLRECVGVEIARHGGGYSAEYKPHPRISSDTGASPERLQPGEARRMLTDVSSLLGSGLVEGEYGARFSYNAPMGEYQAPAATLRFRRPTAAEAALLVAAAPDRPQFANWGLWTKSCSHPPYEGAIGSENPLRLNLLLQRLFCGPEPPDRIDPGMLDVLAGLFEPERNALKAEIYHARNDIPEYNRMRTAILHASPGLAWWIRMLDQGGAYLKTFRTQN
jgi:hypothetical protein